MLVTYSIIVSGKVQGVFYRQSTKENAVAAGITGTVENLPTGQVKIIATGTKEQIEALTGWCKKGPPKAIVTSIEITELPLQPFGQFSIIR
ncbi:MAG: acylphosphatase [Chitinophagales bacterium]|nr:acylphosphatase [Chitinophagales bacterium]